MFSDESRFSLFSSDRRFRAWKSPGQCSAPCNISETVPFGGGSVMVKGGINSEAKSDLHVFPRGNLTALWFISEILEDYEIVFFKLGRLMRGRLTGSLLYSYERLY